MADRLPDRRALWLQKEEKGAAKLRKPSICDCSDANVGALAREFKALPLRPRLRTAGPPALALAAAHVGGPARRLAAGVAPFPERAAHQQRGRGDRRSREQRDEQKGQDGFHGGTPRDSERERASLSVRGAYGKACRRCTPVSTRGTAAIAKPGAGVGSGAVSPD